MESQSIRFSVQVVLNRFIVVLLWELRSNAPIYSINYASDHFLLIYLIPYNPNLCPFLPSPNLHHSFLIHTNVLRMNPEESKQRSQLRKALEALVIGMNRVWIGEFLEIVESERYFFDVDMSYRPGDTELLTAFFLEVKSSHPTCMVLPAVVQIQLLINFILVQSIDLVLLNMEVTICFVLPKSHILTRLTHL